MKGILEYAKNDDKCFFFIIIQPISCRYIMTEHNNFFYNFWRIILQFYCNKNYMCAYKIICLHLYFHFISICQITIYVWPLKEPTVISIKLIYYRFVAYLSKKGFKYALRKEYETTQRSECIAHCVRNSIFFSATKTNPKQAC